MEQSKLQVNASLKFSPTGELLSRDLLLNFREQSVEEVVTLLGDFSRKFNLNLGIVPTTGTEAPAITKPVSNSTPLLPTQCERCGAVLVKRTVRKAGHQRYGQSFLGCSNYRTGCLGVHWL